VKRMTVGTGFCCPPDREPLPDWRPWMKSDPERLWMDERQVLEAINRLLVCWGRPTLGRVTDLYTRVDENVLTTFKELDHFGERTQAQYSGAWCSGPGAPPEWPGGAGKKVYADLKPFRGMPALLQALGQRRLRTVIRADGIDRTLRRRFSSETLRFESRPIELEQASRECDVAILDATHATTASMLLAGKPVLMLPLYLEQQLIAENVAKLGAGLAADPRDRRQITEGFGEILSNRKYAKSARGFSARYADIDARRQIGEVTDRIEQVL